MMFVLVAAPALMGVQLAQPRRFGDWWAVCDNVRHCEAVALPPEESDDQLTMSVARDAGPKAGVEVEVSGMFDEELPPGGWSVDGRQVALSGVPLLRVLAKARKAQWVLPSGKVHAELPVSGAAAALRWIDDQQRRAGSVTAIVANGIAPASSVPPPPSPPRIVAAPPSTKPPRRLDEVAVAAARRKGDCSVEEGEVTRHRLDAAHSLALIPCDMGAYQGPSLVLIVDEAGRWSPAPIEWPAHFADWRTDAISRAQVTSADFSDGMLGTWDKGRGLGDCGYSATWVWDGNAFRLASFAGLDECRGSRAWPSLWQTANVPRR